VDLTLVVPLTGLVALIFAFWRATWVSKQEVGTPEMAEIAGYIQEGAMAFLVKEYRVLSVFVALVAVALAAIYYTQAPENLAEMTGNPAFTKATMALVAVSFVVGAICSGLAV